MQLKAENIEFHYPGAERILYREFNFSMDTGQRIGLLAPSGFGKTTLLKILAGYQRPDMGLVTLDGIALSHIKGYCPVQLIWQHPELSVNPKLSMGRILTEAGPVEDRILAGLGIEPDWLTRYPHELSGGELQRFCIARALGQKTRFLLADEISAMLDLVTQSQIWNFLLREVESREIGLLAVSHSEVLLKQICTRWIDLEQGI